jgi:hypothetical protein
METQAKQGLSPDNRVLVADECNQGGTHELAGDMLGITVNYQSHPVVVHTIE